MTDTWYGTQGDLIIGDALSSVATDSSLDNQLTGTSYKGIVKEVSVSPGEHGVDVINVFGGQLVEESRPEMVTVELTLVFDNLDVFEEFLGTASTVGTTNFERISGSDNTGSRTKKAILIKLVSGSKQWNILLNNAYFTVGGEISMPGDGSFEVTATAKCLRSDYYIEYKSS